MTHRLSAGVLLILIAGVAMTDSVQSQTSPPAASSATAPAATAPIVPIPPIQTSLGTMPGIDALPVRNELPDPLVMDDGQRVTTVAQWQTRREEIKKILEYYATGLMPPPPGNVSGHELRSAVLLKGTVRYRLVHLTFGPGESLGFDIAIFTPMGVGPCPTIIVPGGVAPGSTAQKTMHRPAEQGRGLDAMTVPLGIPTTEPASRPSTRPTTQISYRAGSGVGSFGTKPPMPEQSAEANAELFKRGYALVTYNNQDCGEDTIARNLDGSWAFRNTRFFPKYPNYDWGLVGSWAWGLSRVVDYLQTQPFADKSKIIATGHSRIGKAILVVGAFDDRIALVAPVGSSGGGVGAYRLTGAGQGGREGLDDMMKKYPNWFSPHLYQFYHHAEKLPFDQHWFVALCAPRPFIALEGLADTNGNANAIKYSEEAAKTVYALYGAADRVGVHYADHPHAFADADWDALLDFADQQLLGKKVSTRFDQFPSE